jgi:hypothetical protein
MPKKAKNKGKPECGTSVVDYGMYKSQQRLFDQGFHPAVTSKTPEQIEKDWCARIDPFIERPTRDEFMRHTGSLSGPFGSPARHLTTVREKSSLLGAIIFINIDTGYDFMAVRGYRKRLE